MGFSDHNTGPILLEGFEGSGKRPTLGEAADNPFAEDDHSRIGQLDEAMRGMRSAARERPRPRTADVAVTDSQRLDQVMREHRAVARQRARSVATSEGSQIETQPRRSRVLPVVLLLSALAATAAAAIYFLKL